MNKILMRNGTVWEEDYHDRFIRDEDHYANCIRYIEQNPVTAGLVNNCELWDYSSAATEEVDKEQ